MQKLIIVLFVLVALIGSSSARSNHRLESSTLNAILKSALTEIIENGEYESILNKHLGYGSYVIPECNGALWPQLSPYSNDGGANSAKVFYDVRDILLRGQIRFAGYANEPFAYEGESRIVGGIEYDLGVAIARRISIQYGTFVESYIENVAESGEPKFAALAKALYLGFPQEDYYNNDIVHEYDAIMGTLARSEVRNRVVHFVSCPYFISYLTVIRTPLDSTIIINTVEDLQKPGVISAVLVGTSGHQFAVAALPEGNYVVAESGEELAEIILSGSVHAAIAPAWQVQYFIDQSGCDLCYPTGINLSTENYAFATRYISNAFSLTVSMISVLFAFLVFVF